MSVRKRWRAFAPIIHGKAGRVITRSQRHAITSLIAWVFGKDAIIFMGSRYRRTRDYVVAD